jgi:hypothetical protein
MPLNNTGLVVRYYIDEAASGTGPTAVLDKSGVGTAANLSIVYDGVLQYTEDANGNRGILNNSTVFGNQRLVYAIQSGDKILSNINGSTVATLEVVATLTEANSSGSRIFGINNTAGAGGSFILRVHGVTDWQFGLNNVTRRSWNGGSNTRDVWHIVFDSSQSNEADRGKIYRNGSLVSATTVNSIPQGTTISTAAGENVIAFNRENAGSFARSWKGTLFYAALYSVAFSSSRVADHYGVLTADDDEPVGGGGGGLAGPLVGCRLLGVKGLVS